MTGKLNKQWRYCRLLHQNLLIFYSILFYNSIKTVKESQLNKYYSKKIYKNDGFVCFFENLFLFEKKNFLQTHKNIFFEKRMTLREELN